LGELGGLTRALSAATDVQKLAVTVVGFVATLALIKFITQIAALGGTGTTSRPGSSGFGGFGGTPSNVGDAILGSLLAGLLAAVIWWVGSSLTLGTVARMCVAELSDGRPIPWRSAVGYAARHIDGFLLGPLVFGLLLLLLTVAEILILLIGRIPFLGELLIGVAFLPLLLLNLLGMLTLIFGWFLLFPAVAVEGASAINAGLHVIGLIRRNPLRVVVQLWTTFLMAFVVTLILGGFMVATFAITVTLTSVGLGDKASQIMAGLLPFGNVISSFLGQGQPPFTIGIAQFLVSISIAAFATGLLAIPAVFVIASCCDVYLAGAERRRAAETQEAPVLQPALVPEAGV
jgi:hypothetical protein